MSLPSLGKTVEVDVYVIHNSIDPEDYFFLFDFESFVSSSKSGYFVRPAIRIFAGRSDFGRLVFARQFRQVFAKEFDAMRAKLGQKQGSEGWLSWDFAIGSVSDLVGSFVANLFLAIALSAGKQLLNMLSVPKLFQRKSDEQKLTNSISEMKSQVETALQTIEITVHPELFAHLETLGYRGQHTQIDSDAWPLPEYVRTHITQNTSGSWW